MKSILAPVDGSEASIRALSFAAQFARSLSARIDVLYVFDDFNEIMAAVALRNGKAIDDAVERISKKRLDEAIDRAKPEGVPLERHHRVGQPASEIVLFAESTHPYLIVLGSRGRSALEHLFVGSVSLRVLHRSRFPVTIVR
jgi:nucleotide-binding universal stress UspA family protein